MKYTSTPLDDMYPRVNLSSDSLYAQAKLMVTLSGSGDAQTAGEDYLPNHWRRDHDSLEEGPWQLPTDGLGVLQ